MQPPRSMTVHPHTRGEHALALVSAPHLGGSSPHPWGTRRFLRDQGGCRRFIPTPVGNTAASLGWSMSADGSSPHPWGTLLPKRKPPNWGRFIPTPVGNTETKVGYHLYPTVHPHTHGEHRTRSRPAAVTAGSSPHPWGTPGDQFENLQNRRFIPTPVGNTSMGQNSPAGVTVHPHTRGEHGSNPSPIWRACGSSPHPWGTPDPGGRHAVPGRFIPTPVGNTLTVSHCFKKRKTTAKFHRAKRPSRRSWK